MNKQNIFFFALILTFVIFSSCKKNNSTNNQINNQEVQIDEIANPIQIYVDEKSEISEHKDLIIKLGDTIFLGGNVGKITNFKPKRNDIDYLLSVIIENEYDEGEIVKDTFSNGTLTPWFGIYAKRTGFKNVKGVIMVEALNDVDTDNDSVLRIERTFIHFSKKVFVLDSIQKQK